jgi:predicted metal-binding protein
MNKNMNLRQKMSFHTIPIKFNQLKYVGSREEVSKLCLQPFKFNPNGCPNYNRNWSCPPNSPNPTEFWEKKKQFGYIWLVYIEYIISSNKRIKKRLNRIKTYQYKDILNNFMRFLSKKYRNIDVLYSSHCNYCNNEYNQKCTCPDEPCRYPEMKMISPEAAGVNLFETMELLGIKLEQKDIEVVRRISMVFSNEMMDLNEEWTNFIKS